MWYLADTAVVFGDETDLPPDEYLCPRAEGRLRASTSGYGEVRVGRVGTVHLAVKCRHVEVTRTNTRFAAVNSGCSGLFVFRSGCYRQGG